MNRRVILALALALALIACEEEPPKPETRVVGAICDWAAIDGCYRAYQPEPGPRTGRVAAWVTDKGRVVRATYDLGGALESVQSCLLDHARAQSIDDFRGRAGRVDCSWSGNWSDGKFNGWRKRRYFIK